MPEIADLIEEVIRFRDERDWAQFHNSKDLALALSIEAGELNELFLWKPAEQVNFDRLKEELADVLNYAFLLANKHGFDVGEIVREKLAANALKYPVDKAKGRSDKYDKL